MSNSGKKLQDEEERRRRRIQRQRAEQRRRRRRKALLLRGCCGAVLLLVIIGCVLGVRSCAKNHQQNREEKQKQEQEEQARIQAQQEQGEQEVLQQAAQAAAGYDYDGAIGLLKSSGLYEKSEVLSRQAAAYEQERDDMVRVDISQVEHFTFYSLIVDAGLAYNSESAEVQAMNQKTMTVDEFNQTLQSLYEEGYVLVSIRDLYEKETDAQGNVTYKEAALRLPEGKKPFVLSQQDVSYPFYLISSGYGARIVLGEDGKPSVEYRQQDGTVVNGAYDVVPCLDAFIASHPDFCYKNARGILGITGYNGVLGYRTDPDLGKSAEDGNSYAGYGIFDTAAEVQACAAVVQALREEGWDLACGGYGNVSYASTLDRVQADMQKWKERAAVLTGETEFLMYPLGIDIESWVEYSEDNARYAFFKSQGFGCFFGIDESSPSQVQIQSGYVRQAMSQAAKPAAADGGGDGSGEGEQADP